jgi:hypothetical protein
MKLAVPALAAALLLLSACATAPGEEPMTWGYAEPSAQEGPKLAFGTDGTDYLAVLFMCDPNTGRVTFNVPIAEGMDVPAVKLRSGGVMRRYEALAPREPDGYELVYFRTDRSDPTLKAFVKSGRLAIDVYGAFVPHDATSAAARGAVARFAKASDLL